MIICVLQEKNGKICRVETFVGIELTFWEKSLDRYLLLKIDDLFNFHKKVSTQNVAVKCINPTLQGKAISTQ